MEKNHTICFVLISLKGILSTTISSLSVTFELKIDFIANLFSFLFTLYVYVRGFVVKVNTISVKGKEKRMGAHTGMRPDWKKAIVTIDTNPGELKYLGKGGKEVKVSKL